MLKRILIMAGGTGGHVFPALAIAQALKEEGVDIHWLGSRFGLERKWVEGRFPITYLPSKGLRKPGIVAKIAGLFYAGLAFVKALGVLIRYKPNCVLSMGGYVAAPGGIAAKCLRIPVVVHEQNARAGLTNRVLAKFARSVLCAFPEAFDKSIKTHVVGNPVRSEIASIEPSYIRLGNRAQEEPLRVLILGGSQGAQSINTAVFEAIRLLLDVSRGMALFKWQVGERHLADWSSRAQGLQNVELLGFIDHIETAYAWADLVICRSGAMTVSELTAAGLPAIYIPYPHAVDNHQFFNADSVVSRGGGWIVPETELSGEKLVEWLSKLYQDKSTLIMAAKATKSASYPNATHEIVKEVNQCLKM